MIGTNGEMVRVSMLSVRPVNSIPTDIAAKPAFPVERANLPSTLDVQSADVAVLISRFEPARCQYYLGTLIRIAVDIPISH